MLQSISARPDAMRQLKYAETDPDLQSLHDDPRFQKVMTEANKGKRKTGVSVAQPAQAAE